MPGLQVDIPSLRAPKCSIHGFLAQVWHFWLIFQMLGRHLTPNNCFWKKMLFFLYLHQMKSKKIGASEI
jgi:hypothetical protein